MADVQKDEILKPQGFNLGEATCERAPIFAITQYDDEAALKGSAMMDPTPKSAPPDLNYADRHCRGEESLFLRRMLSLTARVLVIAMYCAINFGGDDYIANVGQMVYYAVKKISNPEMWDRTEWPSLIGGLGMVAIVASFFLKGLARFLVTLTGLAMLFASCVLLSTCFERRWRIYTWMSCTPFFILFLFALWINAREVLRWIREKESDKQYGGETPHL